MKLRHRFFPRTFAPDGRRWVGNYDNFILGPQPGRCNVLLDGDHSGECRGHCYLVAGHAMQHMTFTEAQVNYYMRRFR